MFSFFKTNGSVTSVPEWSSFFNDKEYSLFIREVDNYFKKLNIRYEIQGGQVMVDEKEFGSGQLGLLNVAQLCKQVGPKNYREMIARHFLAMTKVSQFDMQFAKVNDDFEEMKKYFGVRLYNDEYVAQVGKENTVGKNFSGDIYAMVVLDLPNSVMSIKPEQPLAWNKTVDELFEIGISNMKAKYPLTINKHVLDQFSIWCVHGDHFFTPNIVFDLENRKELVGTEGSLIGLPHRHTAIIYTIENSEVVKAIHHLIPAIYGINQEGPGSLSNHLFWYKDKTFTPLPYKIEDNNIHFFPPDNFVQLLNQLQ